jgi:hypothetical protein
LYTQLRWPLPANPRAEHEAGQELTAYLWRGSDDVSPAFVPPAKPAPAEDDDTDQEEAGKTA